MIVAPTKLIEVSTAARIARVSPQTIRRWCLVYGIGRKIAGRFLVEMSALTALISGDVDCVPIKKERQDQQKQHGSVSSVEVGAYRLCSHATETMPMLNAETIPPRREPNIETVSASLPFGARERIRAAAAAERMTAGEFVRRAILRAAAPDLLQGAN